MKIIDHQRIDGVIPNARGQRSFPTTALAHFDPFVMLDHIGPSTMPIGWKLDGGSDESPNLHPHRGFETITFMFAGNLHHRDSVFTDRPLLSNGSVQQMNAGSGIRHGGDMWPDASQQFHEIQLWVNNPAKHKMSPPSIFNATAQDIPTMTQKSTAGETQLRIVAGTLNEITGPIKTFANIRIIHGKTSGPAEISWPHSHFEKLHNRTLLYLLSGSATVQKQTIKQFQAVAFETPLTELDVSFSDNAEFLLLSGKSLNENIVYGGPFIMNNQQQIEQAYQDANKGVF